MVHCLEQYEGAIALKLDSVLAAVNRDITFANHLLVVPTHQTDGFRKSCTISVRGSNDPTLMVRVDVALPLNVAEFECKNIDGFYVKVIIRPQFRSTWAELGGQRVPQKVCGCFVRVSEFPGAGPRAPG